MSEAINLFHGDNGDQEFYQSDASENVNLMLLRVKSESFWQVWKNGLVVTKKSKEQAGVTHIIGSENLQAALEKLIDFSGFKCVINEDFKWKRVNNAWVLV